MARDPTDPASTTPTTPATPATQPTPGGAPPSPARSPGAAAGQPGDAGNPGSAPGPAVPWSAAWRFWLKLGFISFGGPAGQIAIMHAELVARRRWLSERRFLHALNYCMLLPGPEAQQLATYLGWLMHRTAGGLVAGVLFVLPSFVILVALSAAYMVWGQQPLMAGLLYGVKPAVVAIVLQAAWRIGSRVLHHPLLWAIAAAAFIAIALLRLPFPAIVLGAALLGLVAVRWAPGAFGARGAGHGAPAAAPRSAAGAPVTAPAPRALIDDDTPPPAHARFRPARLAVVLAVGLVLWAAPMALLAAWGGLQGTLAQMGWFFTKAAWLTFGGAYAVLPYVHQGAVVQHGWLSPPQMMDGLALGETTPGPLIMVVAFVAFVGAWQSADLAALLGPGQAMLAGVLGAAVVTWFTFLPSFLLILTGGPLVEATRDTPRLTAPLTAISAAVVGVVLSLALFFGQHVLWPQGLAGGLDGVAALILAGAAAALMLARRGVVTVIAACALLGLAVRTWG